MVLGRPQIPMASLRFDTASDKAMIPLWVPSPPIK